MLTNYEDVLKEGFGYVQFSTRLDKNLRVMAVEIWKRENTDISYLEFLSELDGLFITGTQGEKLMKHRSKIDCKSYIIRTVKNFLIDYWRKLKTKRNFRKNVSSGQIESPEQHWAQLNADRQEARRMVDKIFSVVDDDEAQLLLYKWGLKSREEIKQYFGNVSDTVISRRWKKLQAKLQEIKEEL